MKSPGRAQRGLAPPRRVAATRFLLVAALAPRDLAVPERARVAERVEHHWLPGVDALQPVEVVRVVDAHPEERSALFVGLRFAAREADAPVVEPRVEVPKLPTKDRSGLEAALLDVLEVSLALLTVRVEVVGRCVRVRHTCRATLVAQSKLRQRSLSVVKN